MTNPADNTTPPDATPTEGTPGEAPTTTPEATPGAAAPTEPLSPQATEMRNGAIAALREIYDPEIPVDIYELGLIYEVNVDVELERIHIVMTLTSPTCPVAESLPLDVETRVRDVEGVSVVNVELVWDPPWSMDRLSEAAKLQMGLT